MCLLYKAVCWSTCGKGIVGVCVGRSMICDGCDAEQEPFQDPLSLSLGVFFTALKNSNIRNRVKVSLTTVKAASVNSMSWRQKKGFANTLPVSRWRSCKPQSLPCEGEFSVLPCWWFMHHWNFFFYEQLFPHWTLKASSNASSFLQAGPGVCRQPGSDCFCSYIQIFGLKHSPAYTFW